MNDLSNSIYTYYLSHFDEVTFEKQFHFASRLYLWKNEETARQLLDMLRPEFTASDNPAQALKNVSQMPFKASKNAAELRQPYFDRYPDLRVQVLLLFRLMFLQTLYGLDGKKAFFELCPQSELEKLFEQLLKDDEALAILSTHAVNFLYLYTRMVLEDDSRFSPELFLRVGRNQYDRSQPIHLQLLIYLYTHCTIGESKFYSRHLPDTYLPIYRQMMDELEELISANFELVNMDNKFEFLVCANLIGFQSQLVERIQQEAAASLSDKGTFIIDRHNQNPQTANVDLDGSEHRNVLYIMANQAPRPDLSAK